MTQARIDSLWIGQRVDLQNDIFADPLGHLAAEGEGGESDHPEFEYEFESVVSITDETTNGEACLVIEFASGFTCGFPPDHEVDIDGEQIRPEPEHLPVIFRAERSGDFKGDVTAVFPTLPGTNDPYSFTVYAHIGQHSSGGRLWYNGTRAAKPDEYADLLAELRRIYESDPSEPLILDVRQRFTQEHDRARRAELERMNRAARRQG